jgi:hypothetical protein
MPSWHCIWLRACEAETSAHGTSELGETKRARSIDPYVAAIMRPHAGSEGEADGLPGEPPGAESIRAMSRRGRKAPTGSKG